MAVTREVTLPNFEKVSKEFEKLEKVSKISVAKLKRISQEVNELKIRKQSLKVNLEEVTNSITYYEDVYADLIDKTELTKIDTHKAELCACRNLQIIQELEQHDSKENIVRSEFDFQRDEKMDIQTRDPNLLEVKLKLENNISTNLSKIKRFNIL